MDGFWIILKGTGGELDREFVNDDSEIARKLSNLLNGDWSVLSDGDIIAIEAGWSEEG